MRGLFFLLMPLFPKNPPSVDSGLWGKRPIKGSVTHLPPHTHTLTHTRTHKHSDIHAVHFLFLLFLLYISHTDTKVFILLSSEWGQDGIKFMPTHTLPHSLSNALSVDQPVDSHQNLFLRCSVSALLCVSAIPLSMTITRLLQISKKHPLPCWVC